MIVTENIEILVNPLHKIKIVYEKGENDFGEYLPNEDCWKILLDNNVVTWVHEPLEQNRLIEYAKYKVREYLAEKIQNLNELMRDI